MAANQRFVCFSVVNTFCIIRYNFAQSGCVYITYLKIYGKMSMFKRFTLAQFFPLF